MVELKPCPFCGGEAVLFTTLTGQKHFVECPECGAGFDQDYLWSDTKEQAKSKWNTRTATKRHSWLAIFKRRT